MNIMNCIAVEFSLFRMFFTLGNNLSYFQVKKHSE